MIQFFTLRNKDPQFILLFPKTVAVKFHFIFLKHLHVRNMWIIFVTSVKVQNVNIIKSPTRFHKQQWGCSRRLHSTYSCKPAGTFTVSIVITLITSLFCENTSESLCRMEAEDVFIYLIFLHFYSTAQKWKQYNIMFFLWSCENSQNDIVFFINSLLNLTLTTIMFTYLNPDKLKSSFMLKMSVRAWLKSPESVCSLWPHTSCF